VLQIVGNILGVAIGGSAGLLEELMYELDLY